VADADALPIVSVILPTFQRDEWLLGALGSVLAQSWAKFEVIVSDGAASDATRALVTATACGDPRVRYRRNELLLDSLGNHVAAIAEARGRYIAVLHDDDLWEKDFLARLVPPLESRPECVLSFCDQTIMDVEGRVSGENSDAASRRWGRASLAEGVHLPFWNLVVSQAIPALAGCVIRREALRPEILTPLAGSAIDLWITFALCRAGQGAYYVPERLIRYRVHRGADTARLDNCRETTVWVWEQIANEPGLDEETRKTVLRRLSRARQRTSYLLARLGSRRAALRGAVSALQECPSLRGVAVLAVTALPRPLVLAVDRLLKPMTYGDIVLK